MWCKFMRKWEDYITEIMSEYYIKLNEYVEFGNYGDAKKTKTFQLKKNGENTNIFTNQMKCKYECIWSKY